MTRFLADECVWRLVVKALRDAGFVGDWIGEVMPSLSDRDILARSAAEQSLVITEDRDFGELVFREGLSAHGVVRVRLSQFRGEKSAIAAEVAARKARLGDSLVGQVTTIEPNRTRQRALPVVVVGKD